MKKLLVSLFAVSVVLVGCGGGNDAFDPNYKQDVKLSAEEQAKAKEIMADQKAPGTVDPKAGVQSSPGTMSVPGKGR